MSVEKKPCSDSANNSFVPDFSSTLSCASSDHTFIRKPRIRALLDNTETRSKEKSLSTFSRSFSRVEDIHQDETPSKYSRFHTDVWYDGFIDEHFAVFGLEG